MNTFRIVSLTAEYAAGIRQAKKDFFGHAVVEQLATGKGPCRVSLQPFIVGQDFRLLISHSPFQVDNAFNQPGPVFISKNEVPPYSDIHRFPTDIKNDRSSFPLSLIGYSEDQQMVFTRLVGNDDVDVLIEAIFAEHPEVAYLHARNAQACCFICAIERV